MRNLAIAQQRDQERYRYVRGGKYDRPKTAFKVGDFVMVKPRDTAFDPQVCPHILQVVAIHCQICGSHGDHAKMPIFDMCNKGFHIYCLKQPLQGVPPGSLQCADHNVTPLD